MQKPLFFNALTNILLFLNWGININQVSLRSVFMKVYLYTYAYDIIKHEGYKSLAMFDKNSEHCKMQYGHIDIVQNLKILMIF